MENLLRRMKLDEIQKELSQYFRVLETDGVLESRKVTDWDIQWLAVRLLDASEVVELVNEIRKDEETQVGEVYS